MISNTGGSKRRKMRKGDVISKREIYYKESGQEYALVTRMLGERRVEVYCFDGEIRLGIIRGKMLGRIFVHIGDIVLVSMREWASNQRKCDLFHKFLPEEVLKLKALKEIPENTEALMARYDEFVEFGIEDDERAEDDNFAYDDDVKFDKKLAEKLDYDYDDIEDSEDSDKDLDEEDNNGNEQEVKEKAKLDEEGKDDDETDEQKAERLYRESQFKNYMNSSDIKNLGTIYQPKKINDNEMLGSKGRKPKNKKNKKKYSEDDDDDDY